MSSIVTCKLVVRSVLVGLAFWLGPYAYAVYDLIKW